MIQQPNSPVPQLRLFQDWLYAKRGLAFPSYDELWRWSVEDLDGFWQAVWDYFGIVSPTPHAAVMRGEMPKARWFQGASVNYAAQVFRHTELAEAKRQPAIVAAEEEGRAAEMGWRELKLRTAAFALALRDAGVRTGDRVAAYLPNTPDAVIALLGCASIGAIWTMCAPDMGTPAVLDRFRQCAPKVLIAADGVFYNGAARDRSATVAEIRAGLPSLETTFVVRTSHADAVTPDSIDFAAATAARGPAVEVFAPEPMPFDHPLWILYSSGTTGLPKAIVHGHGGVILTTLVGNLHLDIGPSYHEDTLSERFHWNSSTGWVMWNVQVGGLLTGTTICLYDGSPKGADPEQAWFPLWSFASANRVTWFGAGAAFHANCRKAGLQLSDTGDLGLVRALGTTGSPLDPETQRWGSAQFAALGRPDVWWCNISGGTDIAASFCAGNRELPPLAPGHLQCRHLGAAVEAWDDDGQPVIGKVGELVCTKPFPSMPLFLWGDEDGERYRETYFAEWPGIWRHGDWLTVEVDGTCAISGRSDATINRHGLRMGTADIYAAVEPLAELDDSMVVDLDDGGGSSELVMFAVPAAGHALDGKAIEAIANAIRTALSPRFVPDRIYAAPTIPRTLSGKKQELPIKRLFLGWPVDEVIDPNLTQNPEVLSWYVDMAREWAQATGRAA